jgi:hypothetical protein
MARPMLGHGLGSAIGGIDIVQDFDTLTSHIGGGINPAALYPMESNERQEVSNCSREFHCCFLFIFRHFFFFSRIIQLFFLH